MKKATRSFFLSVVVSAILLPAFASPHGLAEREAIQIRALPAAAQTTDPKVETTSTTSTVPQVTATSTSPQSTSTTSATAAVSASQATSTASSPSTESATTTHANSAASSSTPQAPQTSVIPTTATNAAGQVITSYVVTTPTTSSQGVSPTSTGSSEDSSGGLSAGSIVGLAVAGGIAALAIILFFVWKFTRKRFADFDDDAIKWPELNSHNNDVHALPTNSTGRAGFGVENDSDVNLTRAPSPGGMYAGSIAPSVPETFGTADPYAVPPLPHLNPNQPYRDEPGAYGQPFYDPYRGPVPNTFADNVPDTHGAESIPMTQMARMRSPGPQAYDIQGRGSPAPQAAIGYAGEDERSRTPVPGASGTGRASPSPHPGYGYGPR